MMTRNSRHRLLALGSAVGLWCGMMVCFELGRRIGISHLRAWGAGAQSGIGAVDGAIFGLLAFLIGFAFNGAANRFDRRRELVAEAANAIGTAWQRIELLAKDQQAEIRQLVSRYVEALVGHNGDRAPADTTDLMRQAPAVRQIQDELWSCAIGACLTPRGEPARVLLLPSLNEMFGAVERERMRRRIHPPLLIFVMLGVTALAAAVFAGYSLANTPSRNWFYLIAVATSISFVTFVVIELEFPRLGWLRIEEMDQELVDLEHMMHPPARAA